MNDEKPSIDESDFLAAMGDVKPLTQDKAEMHSAERAIDSKSKLSAQLKTQTKQATPFSMEGVTPIKPDDFLSYQQPGIQDAVFKNLRLGKYALEQRINLAGKTLQESALAVHKGITHGHAKGQRAIVIQHGKGEQSKPFPALKKSYVLHWLKQIDIVIAFHTAQPNHGGLGATYVLLKKHPDQKQINRELNKRTG